MGACNFKVEMYTIPLCEPLAPIKKPASTGRFDQAWSKFVGTDHGVAFADARSAFLRLFAALGLEKGQRALVSSCCTSPVWDAILEAGLEPVIVEPDSRTLVLDATVMDATVWAGIDVAVVTHLYGRPVPLETIVAGARKYGVPVIEDALHAQGAEYRGRKVGSLGDAGVFCFAPRRILGDEEGGAMVVTSRADLVDGLETDFQLSPEANGRLLAQLKRLPDALKQRERLVDAYREKLGAMEGLRMVLPERQGRHVYYRFVIRVSDPARVAAYLAQAGIETGRIYFRSLDTEEKVPVARAAAREILHLPMVPSQGEKTVDLVCEHLGKIVQEVTANATMPYLP